MHQQTIFLSGICGSGMKPLALIAARQGYITLGTDQNWNEQSARLQAAGVSGRAQPDPQGVAQSDFYVFSSAIREDHPERRAAIEAGIPILHRMDLLNILVRASPVRFSIAGTHGKTSSTAMAGWVLLQVGLDPTIIAGGHPLYLEDGCRNGSGNVAVFETDESDGSFLKTEDAYRLILNIDRDHLSHYGSYDGLIEAFRSFASHGSPVFYSGDSTLQKFSDHIAPLAAFGPEDRATQYRTYYSGSFDGDDALSVLHWKNGMPQSVPEAKKNIIHLSLPGRHFAMNGLGVLAMIHSAIASESVLQKRFDPESPQTLQELIEILNAFPGVERRLEKIGTVNGVHVYDDYGHHPTEIRAVIDALRRRNELPLTVIFQPHRYTRTKELAGEFALALSEADRVFLLPLYSAGEDPLEGVSSQSIAGRIGAAMIDPVQFDAVFEEKPAAVLFLGAGSVSTMARQFVAEHGQREPVF